MTSTTTAATAVLATSVALVLAADGAAAARRAQTTAAVRRGRLTMLDLERCAQGRVLQLLRLAVLVAMPAHGQLVAVRVGDRTGSDGYLGVAYMGAESGNDLEIYAI